MAKDHTFTLEPIIGLVASLAAAISLLENTPKAKKAAASDKMFEVMLSDYRKALEAGREFARKYRDAYEHGYNDGCEWQATHGTCDVAQPSENWRTAVDLTEKSILSEYYSGRLNGDRRIKEGFKNLRAALAAQPPAAPVETEDECPGCGKIEADSTHAEACPLQRSSADSVEVPTDALINLVNYQEQCDEDGVMVKVSRQALAEVLVYVQMTRPDLNGVPQTLPMRQVLADALDSPTIKALCDVFETRGALNKSYSEMVADVLEPRITLAMTTRERCKEVADAPAAPVETGMLGRENDAFHRTLRQYPEASKALHAFWNDAFAGQPQPDPHPGSSAETSDEPDSRLPLQYEDGPDYCTVKDAQGRDFALTMQPDLMKAMERALAPLRLCSYCKTWNSKPCGEQCCWSPTDPVHMTDVPQTEKVTEALQLAKNIIFGAKHAVDRERNYAKSAEYQAYIDTLDVALTPARIMREALDDVRQSGQLSVQERVFAKPSDPIADLVSRFSAALLEKLRAAEAKYGFQNDWMRPDWEAECQRHLAEHLAKGDPRDVAAYAAFCWHHGWPTSALPSQNRGTKQ